MSPFFDPRMRGFRDRTEVAEVLALIDAGATPLAAEAVGLHQAAGRVLAVEVASEVAVPGFDRAAMDGYALRGEETFGAGAYNPLELAIVGEAMPGRPFAGTHRRRSGGAHHDRRGGAGRGRRRAAVRAGRGGERPRSRPRADLAGPSRRPTRRGYRCRARRPCRRPPAAAAGRRAARVHRRRTPCGRAAAACRCPRHRRRTVAGGQPTGRYLASSTAILPCSPP